MERLTHTPQRRRQIDVWMVALIALAAFLRLAHLGRIPSCLEYDEATNVILIGEIVRGEYLPIFVRPYNGKEALYFYLAAGVMKLGGISPFTLRLTSAGLGVLNVALTCWLARRMRFGRWTARLAAALVAVSYWQVHLSRFGYRAIVLPPLLALACGSLLHALRSGQRRWFLLAGACAGLAAHTYSAVRVLPILLLLIWIWVLVTSRGQWGTRLGQLALYGGAALLVFAPLGIYFLRYPETFSIRMSQVSIFNPQVNEGDLPGTLQRTIRAALGMFTGAGDWNPLYNAPGKPVFDALVGPFFYLGLALCAWRLVAPARWAGRREAPRLSYWALAAWLPVMMAPNILSASGVPHNLRAMALVPAVFLVTALGLAGPLEWAAGRLGRRWPRVGALLLPVMLALLTLYEGARTYDYYMHVWAGSAAPYYKGNEALIRAADLLNEHPEADPYVATYFHQHATLAVYAHDYPRIRWLSGGTLILPPPGAPPVIAIYDHTNPVDPVLRACCLPEEALLHTEVAPDGGIGFEAYQLDGADLIRPVPTLPLAINLGNTLTMLGYDLNAPLVSGDVLDVTLYFRVERAVERDDFTFFAHLVDELGFQWAGQTFFYYPSAQWRPGEAVLYRLQLPVAAGAPPGGYTLDVGVFSPSLDARLPVLNEQGQMAGTVAHLGPLAMARAPAPPAALPPIAQPQTVHFAAGPTWLGSERDRSDLLPGQSLALTLYWQMPQPVDRAYRVRVELAGGTDPVRLWDGDPVQGRYPMDEWRAGELVRDRYALRLPLDTPAGDYDLRLALVDESGQPVPSADGPSWFSLGRIHVQTSDRLWAPPEIAYPLGARVGEAFELLGYDLDRQAARPGETLHLTLYWRCRAQTETAYTVFTHLLDEGGQVRGQKDNPPMQGDYPTTLWAPDEVIVDPYAIPIAADAPAGRYAIEVGMYDPATMQRLPVLDPAGGGGNRVLLGQVQVE